MRAVTTSPATGRTSSSLPVSSAAAARVAAARVGSTSDDAEPGLPLTTTEKEPSGCWPKLFLRMSPAFSLSEPGRTKRFVRRSLSPADAIPETTTTTNQVARTNQRNRIIVRASCSISTTSWLPKR